MVDYRPKVDNIDPVAGLMLNMMTMTMMMMTMIRKTNRNCRECRGQGEVCGRGGVIINHLWRGKASPAWEGEGSQTINIEACKKEPGHVQDLHIFFSREKSLKVNRQVGSTLHRHNLRFSFSPSGFPASCHLGVFKCNATQSTQRGLHAVWTTVSVIARKLKRTHKYVSCTTQILNCMKYDFVHSEQGIGGYDNPTTRILNSSPRPPSHKKTRIFGNFGFSVNFWIFAEILNFLDFFVIVFGFFCDFLDFCNALSNHCTVAWVTLPECPKGVKDEVKQARRAAT